MTIKSIVTKATFVFQAQLVHAVKRKERKQRFQKEAVLAVTVIHHVLSAGASNVICSAGEEGGATSGRILGRTLMQLKHILTIYKRHELVTEGNRAKCGQWDKNRCEQCKIRQKLHNDFNLGVGPLWPVKHREEILGYAIVRKLVCKQEMLVLGRNAKNKLQGQDTSGRLFS